MDDTIQKIFDCVQKTEIGSNIIDLLVPEGKPLQFECGLWDFKRKPPLLPDKPNDAERDLHKHETHELIKDVVSFHNAYGGYLVFGVEDTGADKVTGCEYEIELGDLGKRIKAQTGADIDLYQNSLNLGSKTVLLLLIPRRRSHEKPIQFIKAAPRIDGKQAYQKNSIYVRVNDECRPANNTADDWSFLFSERRLGPAPKKAQKEKVPSNLPPRDPDMVRFVGREDELRVLRSWVLDHRNPIKLISGIGGLGKTSVAYHFCEELVETTAGDFDYLAGVSAKKSTFAALRGQMVKTTRHDFSTVEELLQQLIALIAGESSVDDGLDIEEYIEILTDALIYRPSFIVVDDLDSLSPEDQRECATILQQIAFRTVDREHLPSKVLLTSRLDQGLSPTAVIKITGLDQSSFSELVYNLCDQFALEQFRPSWVKEIYKASSGSPLFASAIIRMASLGENPKKICSSWASEDGEDVREFAFKRELDRLSVGGASVLLAVVNLGEVSTEELLEVVEVTRKKLLDQINELQSFHLLSRSENRQGDPVLTTSKELVSSAGILRKKLGLKAHEIERRCAKIRKNQGDQSREVGRGINRIVSLWEEGSLDEALVVAKELSTRNPKNGDVWCALAGAFLKVRPQQFSNADDAATKAIALSCNRRELFEYVVVAKNGTEDWQGLKSFTENKRFKSKKHDPALDAFIVAVTRLANLANARGSFSEASSYALEGVRRISEKVSGSGLEQKFFDKLAKDQNRLAKEAIYYRKKSIQRDRDHLLVADLAFEAANLDVLTREIVSAFCEGLMVWSDAVRKTGYFDEAATDIIGNNLQRLDRLTTMLATCSRDVRQDLSLIDKTRKKLGFTGATF